MKRHASFGKFRLAILVAFALWPSPARALHCTPESSGNEKRVAATQIAFISAAQPALEEACCDPCRAPAKPAVSRACAPDALKCALRSASDTCCCAPRSPDATESVLRAPPEMPLAIAAAKQGNEAYFVSCLQTKARAVLDVRRSRGAPSPFAPRGPPASA